jgi:hypothetical protein
MGAIASRSLALGSRNPVTSVSAQSDACAQDQADGTEITSGADTDNVDLQCGDQNAPDTSVSGAADTDNVQVDEQVGDQSVPNTGMEAPEVEAPAAP